MLAFGLSLLVVTVMKIENASGGAGYRGRNSHFAFERVELKMPMKHPHEYVEEVVGYMSLETIGEL